jgi:hypothetical protein
VYDKLAEIMRSEDTLNDSTADKNFILDQFDFYLAEEKGCFSRLTLMTTLIHSIWSHSSASQFNYFAK